MRTVPTNKCKRIVLRVATIVVVLSALGAAYWLIRPPELVWWTSRPIGKLRRHVQVLVPRGWKLAPEPGGNEQIIHGEGAHFRLRPDDSWPRFLRRIFQRKPESANISIGLEDPTNCLLNGYLSSSIMTADGGNCRSAWRHKVVGNPPVLSQVLYTRTNLGAFNRTYKKICDSLTFE